MYASLSARKHVLLDGQVGEINDSNCFIIVEDAMCGRGKRRLIEIQLVGSGTDV